MKYLNARTERVFDSFSEIAGKKACDILLRIWSDWRKERREADAMEEAEKALSRAGKRHIRKHIKQRSDIIQKAFDIGFGTYNKDCKTDFQKGAESAFVYGYLCAMEDQEKKQPAENDNTG